MKFKYAVPAKYLPKTRTMKEFANGGMQVTVRLRDGREIPKVLLSDGTYFIAARGFEDLPFKLEDIDDVYQSVADKNPRERGGWKFWDDWD